MFFIVTYTWLKATALIHLSSGRLLHPPCLVTSPMDQRQITQAGYDIHRASHGRAMALIEIDGLPSYKMLDLSMANC